MKKLKIVILVFGNDEYDPIYFTSSDKVNLWVEQLEQEEKALLKGAWLYSTEEFNSRIIPRERLYKVF